MEFIISEEYPSGAIVCIESELETLKAKGWMVDMHTAYYVNYLGSKLLGLNIGFGGWLGNLTPVIDSEEVGYYSDSWIADFKVNSQDSLDKFIQFIDASIKFKESFPKN